MSAKPRIPVELAVRLREMILDGTYKPGEKLPPERALARDLGVNRASLREALKKLEHLGLVRGRQGDGTRVLDYTGTASLDLLPHLLGRAAIPQAPLLNDLLGFRRLLGREIAREASLRATREDIEALRRLLDAQVETTGDLSHLLRLDYEFLMALARASHNRVYQMVLNSIQPTVDSFARQFNGLRLSLTMLRRHQRLLLRMITGRQPDLAARAVDEFVLRDIDSLGNGHSTAAA